MVEAVPDEAMDGEMDMEDMEGMDAEADENGADEEDEDGDGEEKNEYVKKEFVARPWESETLQQTIEEVKAFTIENERPLIRTRVTMKRREFGNEATGQFIDKEPGD